MFKFFWTKRYFCAGFYSEMNHWIFLLHSKKQEDSVIHFTVESRMLHTPLSRVLESNVRWSAPSGIWVYFHPKLFRIVDGQCFVCSSMQSYYWEAHMDCLVSKFILPCRSSTTVAIASAFRSSNVLSASFSSLTSSSFLFTTSAPAVTPLDCSSLKLQLPRSLEPCLKVLKSLLIKKRHHFH